jgi:hypothetical protein
VGSAPSDGPVVTSSWAAPDSRATATTPLVFAEASAVPADPPVRRELVAGVLTALGMLLCGPVVGLLWAALAPRSELVVDGSTLYPRDRESSAFIAGDGLFLALGALAGALTALLAWRLARRYGLGVVVGILVGGLAAAYLAEVVGEAVGPSLGEWVGDRIGRPDVGDSLGAGSQVPPGLAFRLRAREALLGWPVGGLLSFLAASMLIGRSGRR